MQPSSVQNTDSSSFTPDLVTDLKKIERFSSDRFQENADFAKWLKTQNSENLDQIVREISTSVAANIDCTACANCCSSLVVAPDYRDVSALAEHLGTPVIDFKKKYMRKDTDGDFVFKQKPCPFLKNNKCSVYTCRPQLCRGYPYLDKGAFIASLGRTLSNLFVCPIVFNTFELLKLRFT